MIGIIFGSMRKSTVGGRPRIYIFSPWGRSNSGRLAAYSVGKDKMASQAEFKEAMIKADPTKSQITLDSGTRIPK
jgi:hypothetical protein